MQKYILKYEQKNTHLGQPSDVRTEFMASDIAMVVSCYPHPQHTYSTPLNSLFLNKSHKPGVVMHTLITALRRERQVDFWSSRPA